MSWFRRKKIAEDPVVEEPQEFSHSSGATKLDDVVEQHKPKYDDDKPRTMPLPRGRASRLFPDEEPRPEPNPFEVKRR